jgi:hypothetical protein
MKDDDRAREREKARRWVAHLKKQPPDTDITISVDDKTDIYKPKEAIRNIVSFLTGGYNFYDKPQPSCYICRCRSLIHCRCIDNPVVPKGQTAVTCNECGYQWHEPDHALN